MANQYLTCVLDAWREGTTLFGRMHYYRTDGLTYTYQDTSFPDPTMNLGGVTYSDTDFGNRVRSGISIGNVYTTTFSRTVAGTGTRTVTFTAGSGLRSDFQGTWSVDVGGFPGVVTPPTGLAVSNAQKYQNSFAATVSVTGWGGAGDASSRYRELQVWTYNASSLVEPRKYQKATGDTMSSVITVDNNSGYGTLTIEPNTMYTIGMYATNGTHNTGSQRVGDWTTLPPTPSLTNTAVTTNSATFSYSVPNQGGKYDMAVKYQLNSGSLVNVTTLTGSGTKNGNFTVSNLAAGTTYTIVVSLTTTVGEVVSNTVTFTTTALPSTTKFYGSVNGSAKKINKLYLSWKKVNTISADTSSSYINSFDPSVFKAKLESTIISNYIGEGGRFTHVEFERFTASTPVYTMTIYYYDKNNTLRTSRVAASSSMLTLYTKAGEWGFSINNLTSDVLIKSNFTATYNQVTKKITKLYGSQNGVTKLVFEDV